MSDQEILFVEEECEEGSWLCTAWNDWFWACHAADATAQDEGRDPDKLCHHDFHPSHCRKRETCPLYHRSRLTLDA